ncbi:MAG: hypothetical protein JWP75_133 [Frondihabitans sp.]|nr:hypothetical protein [Frondihabitans sp.]
MKLTKSRVATTLLAVSPTGATATITPVDSRAVPVSASDGVSTHAVGSEYGYVTGLSSSETVASYVVINSSSAPDEYRFRVAENGQTLRANDDGSVSLLDRAGVVVNYLTPAWATDAAGRDVETSYEVDGDMVVQTVAHRGATYPVTADPSFGCGVGWCSMYFNKSDTKKIAGNSGAGAALITAACTKAPGPVAFVCGIALGHIADRASSAAGSKKCVGLVVYGVPPIVTWNAFIHNKAHCR